MANNQDARPGTHPKHQKLIIRASTFPFRKELHGKLIIKNRPCLFKRNSVFLLIWNCFSRIPLKLDHTYIVWRGSRVSRSATEAVEKSAKIKCAAKCGVAKSFPMQRLSIMENSILWGRFFVSVYFGASNSTTGIPRSDTYRALLTYFFGSQRWMFDDDIEQPSDGLEKFNAELRIVFWKHFSRKSGLSHVAANRRALLDASMKKSPIRAFCATH